MNLGTIAFNNLWRRKARMVFLLAGLLLGVATVVTLLLGPVLYTAFVRDLKLIRW